MLTKEYISSLKNSENDKISELIKKQSDSRSINFILESLGRLPKGFHSGVFFELLEHKNKHIRLNAVKNIGKLNGNTNFQQLIELYHKENESTIKREIVSALGRQKNKSFIPFFIDVLDDNDPKIVLQAVRSLLVFGEDTNVTNRLKELINHPNEMVRTSIYQKFFTDININSQKMPHNETYDFLKNVVVNGDVLEVLKKVPDESIHLTFTSPPYYNARDYSIYESYDYYLNFLEDVFKSIHRVTKEGRFLIVNTSPIIIPRISRAHSSKRYPIPFDLHNRIVKNGWEFIDDIIWLKPESSVKNRVGGFMQHRKPLAYKPNAVTEYLMVYRKATSKLLDWNIRSYPNEIVEASKVKDEFETNNVWKIDPVFDKVHSAVFPKELCKRVVRYYSFKGDLVFDPFGGSGTLGRTAKALDRRFFITEINTDYFEYMKSKTKSKTMFNERITKFQTFDEFKKAIKDDNH